MSRPRDLKKSIEHLILGLDLDPNRELSRKLSNQITCSYSAVFYRYCLGFVRCSALRDGQSQEWPFGGIGAYVLERQQVEPSEEEGANEGKEN